jgi:hypothetical protein
MLTAQYNVILISKTRKTKIYRIQRARLITIRFKKRVYYLRSRRKNFGDEHWEEKPDIVLS